MPDKALLEFIETNYSTIKECLDAADALNMSEFFMEGDESLSNIMDTQSDVQDPDDGEHDRDYGATGDRFNDFMDQIPQMNPSQEDEDNYDSDSGNPQYEENGGTLYPANDPTMNPNTLGYMPQPMMQPQQMAMPMQAPMMPMGVPMMQPQPVIQPVMTAQPVQMLYYGQPMPQIQPFAQMQPGVMQAQIPDNMQQYQGGTSQEVTPSQQDHNAQEQPNPYYNYEKPSQYTNQQSIDDPNAPETAPQEDPNQAQYQQQQDQYQQIPDMGADPNQSQQPQDQGVPGQNQMNQEQPPEDTYDQQDPNVPQDEMYQNQQDPNDPNQQENPEELQQDPDDPLANQDPNDPNAEQEGPDENQRLSHNIDQLNKLETQVSNLSEKINNEKIDKLKKSINQLINGVTDNMANLRDKPELPKLNDMIEKFLHNCIDELNTVVDKEKSKQSQEQDQDQQFRQSDQVNPDEEPTETNNVQQNAPTNVNNRY